MITKSKWWSWTNLELIAGTGICTSSEGLEHGPIKFRDHFWFEFYFAYKMNNIASLLTLLSFIKNSGIHLKREWVHPECECFVAGVCVYVCVCVCVCACVCVYVYPRWRLHLSGMWDTRAQIKDVMFKMLISYAKSLHRYFRMQHLNFLTSLFTLSAY